MRRIAVVLLLLLFRTGPAWADAAPADVDRADALFRAGRALMDRGEVAEACTKFEQSFQLLPRLGTMLNLGACYEKAGHLSRALGIYERAATTAHEAGRPDRERAARELAAAVEPRIARLVLVVEDPSPSLVVIADGEPVSTRGGLIPLDPGERQLNARAPGKAPFTTTVNARAGETLRVTIPRLHDEPPPALAPERVDAPPPPRPPPPASAPSHGASARTIGILAGASVAVAGAAVGTVFGLQARSKWNASGPHCDASGCDPDGLSLIHDAKLAGNVSTIAFAAAGAGLLGTALVMLLVPSSPRPNVTISIGPAGMFARAAF